MNPILNYNWWEVSLDLLSVRLLAAVMLEVFKTDSIITSTWTVCGFKDERIKPHQMSGWLMMKIPEGREGCFTAIKGVELRKPVEPRLN